MLKAVNMASLYANPLENGDEEMTLATTDEVSGSILVGINSRRGGIPLQTTHSFRQIADDSLAQANIKNDEACVEEEEPSFY